MQCTFIEGLDNNICLTSRIWGSEWILRALTLSVLKHCWIVNGWMRKVTETWKVNTTEVEVFGSMSLCSMPCLGFLFSSFCLFHDCVEVSLCSSDTWLSYQNYSFSLWSRYNRARRPWSHTLNLGVKINPFLHLNASLSSSSLWQNANTYMSLEIHPPLWLICAYLFRNRHGSLGIT